MTPVPLSRVERRGILRGSRGYALCCLGRPMRIVISAGAVFAIVVLSVGSTSGCGDCRHVDQCVCIDGAELDDVNPPACGTNNLHTPCAVCDSHGGTKTINGHPWGSQDGGADGG